MLERLGNDGAVGEDLEELLCEVVDLIVERPGVGEHDEGQGGGQHHHAGLVHLQHQGLARAGLLGARYEYIFFLMFYSSSFTVNIRGVVLHFHLSFI